MKSPYSLRNAGVIAFLLSMVCISYSCAYKTSMQPQHKASEDLYCTSFPVQNSSSDLERLMLSVKKIKNYSSYRTYIFEEDSKVTLKDLNSETLLSLTKASIVTNDATSGTATVLFSDGKNIALLTCNHAVKAPDTLFQWDEYSDLGNNRYIRSISIKVKQQLYISGLPVGSRFDVLASDPENDIAIIGATYTEPISQITSLVFPCGNASYLRWGSFIYLAGFPTGQQMVVHGIVSLPPGKSGSFLTDAVFNEGLSGGIAIASTQDFGNFEIVGMARSVAATYGYVLKPEKGNHEFIYNSDMPYTGNIFVNQKKDINYGVTSVISIDLIRQFYQDNRIHLLEKGFNLDEFFGLKSKTE